MKRVVGIATMFALVTGCGDTTGPSEPEIVQPTFEKAAPCGPYNSAPACKLARARVLLAGATAARGCASGNPWACGLGVGGVGLAVWAEQMAGDGRAPHAGWNDDRNETSVWWSVGQVTP